MAFSELADTRPGAQEKMKMSRPTASSSVFTAASEGPGRRLAAGLLLGALALVLALTLACEGGGGPNTQSTFRAVFLEPEPGQTGGCMSSGACVDTVRITFNHAIDTTAVLDTSRPRYFLASLTGGGFILDSLGTTVTNEMRTLVIPFELLHGTNYTFTLLQAVDLEGRQLENAASTSFAVECTEPCP